MPGGKLTATASEKLKEDAGKFKVSLSNSVKACLKIKDLRIHTHTWPYAIVFPRA